MKPILIQAARLALARARSGSWKACASFMAAARARRARGPPSSPVRPAPDASSHVESVVRCPIPGPQPLPALYRVPSAHRARSDPPDAKTIFKANSFGGDRIENSSRRKRSSGDGPAARPQAAAMCGLPPKAAAGMRDGWGREERGPGTRRGRPCRRVDVLRPRVSEATLCMYSQTTYGSKRPRSTAVVGGGLTTPDTPYL